MAADLNLIKSDLDKVDDTCLDTVRRAIDACLIINPEDALAGQGVTAVLAAYLAKNDIFVRMSITARQGNQILTTVETSNISQPGFTRAILWLFVWANRRKG